MIGDICKFFEEFHANGKLVRGLNASFISLIPKINCPKEVVDFRPISLIGSVYKLVSKVLAARLQRVMPRIISENQFAFTPGRQISDCILIATEVVDYLNKSKKGGYLLKIDFAKAYDTIEWKFLMDLLEDMNFGDQWMLWIKSCITTASLAVLVNGSPSMFFDIEKGLRQGDPLSPLLFNICANGLSCMLNQLLGDSGINLFSGVKVGDAEALNHLQFADDTLLFCESDDRQLELLCHSLFSFLFASGLRLNMEKSVLIGCNIDPVEVTRVAQIYGWAVGALPITYLGAPLGGNPRRISFWAPMLDKLRKKGRSYNSKYISLSGRITILKAALNSIPVYWMSLFKAPKGIIAEVERIYRAFLWGKEERGRKMVWISWELVCKSKAKGGLGLGHLEWKNKALLLKWVWRYGSEVGSLWRRLIAGKYQWENRNLFLHSVLEDEGSLSVILKDIAVVLMEDSMITLGFKEQLMCGIGDGKNTRFWLDPWCGDKALSLRFPRLFANSTGKKDYIAEVGLFIRNRWVWDIPFRRNFFGWELEAYNEFLNLINARVPAVNSSDSLIWCGSSNGFFSVKGLCSWVDENLVESEEFAVPEKIRKMIPPKVCLLFWQACHNKLATKVNLWRRGVLASDQKFCCFCNGLEETSDHLFVACTRVNTLWINIFRKEGISWSCPNTLLAIQEEWDNIHSGMDTTIWKLIPYAIIWSLWMERNSIIFKGKRANFQDVADMYVNRMAWWIRNAWSGCPFDTEQITRNIDNIRFPSPRSVPRNVSWVPPDIGLIKCNVDGASKGNPGNSGVGGVVRDSTEKFLGYFALGIGFGWAHEAEVKAILMGLQFCQQFLFKNVILESDSTTAIGWVISREKRPWKMLNELNQIDMLMQEINVLEIRHTFREGNDVADCLANVGCEGLDPIWVLLEDGREN